MIGENEGREFRVIPNADLERLRDRRTRVFLWGAASLLVGITLFAVFEAPFVSRQTNLALAWLAGVIVTCTIAGAYILSYQHGLRKLRQSLVLLLKENELVRRRPGWSDVRIGLAEVKQVRERSGWFVVESVQPYTKIAIPTDVQDYEELKEELLKHCPGACEKD